MERGGIRNNTVLHEVLVAQTIGNCGEVHPWYVTSELLRPETSELLRSETCALLGMRHVDR